MQRTTILVAYFFACANCFSQSTSPGALTQTGGQYPFVHYTPKDGLINSRVKKSYQDSKGRMYFLTAGGLSIYDGARFRNYTTQNGLATDIINDILEVGDDSLLLAANIGKLTALVRGKVTSVKTSGEPCPTINQFYFVDKNKIYLACDEGLFLLENKTIRKLNITRLVEADPEQPYLSNINGTKNYLLLTTHELRRREGLYLYDIKNDRISDLLPRSSFYLLGKDRSNNIWVCTSNKLFVVDEAALSKGKLSLVAPPQALGRVKDYSVDNASFDNNSVWLVYRDQHFKSREIHRIDEQGVLLKMPLPEQAVGSDVTNLFIDHEKNIWLSNDGEGVFKIVNSQLQIFKNPFEQLNQGNLNSVYFGNHVAWFNSNSNKLLKQTSKGIEVFSSNLNHSETIIFGDEKKILARDYSNIYEAELNGNKSIFFHKIISLPAPDFFSTMVKVDDNGYIISSQITGLSVWKGNKLIMKFPVAKNDIVEEFAFDKNNFLWAVKRYNGIDVYSLHPQDESKYLQLVNHFSKDQILGSPRSFVLDKNGLIWIGTRDHGLIGYEIEKAQLRKRYEFNITTGLSNNFITALACDSFNNIIVGTQTGLDRLLQNADNSYRPENLSKSSNFFALITQAWSDRNKSYALTNSGVLLQISSHIESKPDHTPRLLLEEMRVNNSVMNPGESNFSYKKNNISFYVAAPSFIDEKQVSFSYLLEGSGNKNWSDTAAANSIINLTNLSPAKYLLKVKAFFPSTSYIPAELSYSFEITPPWWQTWWFRLIAALLIVGILIIGSRFYYQRKLEKQMAALEKQQAIEKERTRIATDMHDDLGAGLSRIKFLSETIGIKKQRHQPIEEDISKIREYSHQMIDKMGEIVWALNEKNDSLSDLLSYSRAYAVEYLSQSGIECDVVEPENFPVKFVSGEFRRNIYLVLKEALHNIVKHAQASGVRIRIDIDQNLTIIIKDNGIGLNKNKLRPFSNGLSNMEKRMRDIGGNIEIKKDDGTTVIFSAPLS